MQKIRETTVSSVQKIILLALMHMAHQMKTVILISVLLWKVSEKEKREVINRINWGIYDVMETPVDILVYGPEEFQERASRTVTMEHKIALEGKVLYEVRDVLE